MSKNGKKRITTKSASAKRAAKKAAVLGNEKKRGLPILPLAIVAVLLIAGGFYFIAPRTEKVSPGASSLSSQPTASEVAHPVAQFEDGKARHFEFKTKDGLTVRYFVLRSSDGVVRAAFDACDVCWPAGKGYYQAGDFMVCRNCGRQFASVLVNEVKGGCNPAPLNRRIAGDNLLIQVAHILQGKQYFDFSGKV